jgi:GMP synthase-like glutamine amidotransferase
MGECSSAADAFKLAGRGETAMNVVAVIQHTSGEYLGLMEDHLEGRRIRFQYFRPFAGGGKLPSPELPADALFLLGGGPWGSAGTRDLPTLNREVELARLRLEEGTPVVGFGLGAQILAIASGGSAEPADLVLEAGIVRRTRDDALNGFLPETFHQVVYMRDRPVLPGDAEVLAVTESGAPAVFRVGDNSYGFLTLRSLQRTIEDELVPIMTGLVQCTQLMSSPKAAERPAGELDTQVF